MADVFSWAKLGLENIKAVIMVWTFLLSLLGGNVWQYFETRTQTKEARSFKQGYEALAQNVQNSQSTPHTHPELINRIKRLEARHF